MTRNRRQSSPRQDRTATTEQMPHGVHLTLLALVTQRMIELRHQPRDTATSREVEQLRAASEWLLDDHEPEGPR